MGLIETMAIESPIDLMSSHAHGNSMDKAAGEISKVPLWLGPEAVVLALLVQGLVAVGVSLAEDLAVPNGQVLILAAGKYGYDTWCRHVATV